MGAKRNFELVFNMDTLDADFALLEALGFPRSRWTPRDIAKRLSYLELCIKHDVAPDAQGWRWEAGTGRARDWKPKAGRHRYAFEGVPVPENLARHMDGLAEAVAHCRDALASGDIQDATQRIGAINELAYQICRDALPQARRAPQKQRIDSSAASRANRVDERRSAIRELLKRSKREPSSAEIARRIGAVGHVNAKGELWAARTIRNDLSFLRQLREKPASS